MASLSFHDRQHVQKLLIQQGTVNNIFNAFARKSSLILARWSSQSAENVWIRNAAIEREIDKALQDLHDDLLKCIEAGRDDAIIRSNLKNDDLITSYIKGMAISNVTQQRLMSRNQEAVRAFLNKVQDGVPLSDKVWNVTAGTKEQIEFFLSSGIADGRPAVGISSDVRQILKNPEKRFRRIRNEEGKLILSKPMQDYHPGQGVYRSSAKNALRLTATETNIAYRYSDHERWQKMGFVLGQEVRRSPSNHGPCAVCDAMVGKYPKDYVFVGQHPWCICICTPIMMDQAEFMDYLFDGTVPEGKIIKSVPQSAIDFVNAKKANQGHLFVKENKQYFDLAVAAPLGKNVIPASYQKITNTVIAVENEIRKNAKFETAVAFDKNGRVLIDKRGKATSVAFTDDEIKLVKDAVFTHNHPRGWAAKENTIGRIGSSFSIQDITFAVGNDVAEIRAVTPTYTFSLKRPEKGWGVSVDKISKMYEKYNSALLSENIRNIRRQNWNESVVERANVSHFHILWKRISRKLKWEYRKIKSNE